MNKYNVIIVGGGAAGLLAAGSAASLGAKVLLLEKMKKTGRKLLITGKGRCNVSNSAYPNEFFKHVHPSGKFLKHAFQQFYSKEIVELLEKQGVKTGVERGGRIFPLSNKASDIHVALLNWVKSLNVEILSGCIATKLIIDEGNVRGLDYRENGTLKTLYANRVIICTGGKSYPATGSTGDGYSLAQSAGHSIVNTRPALVPIETNPNEIKQLQGLSLKNVNAIVWVNDNKIKEAFGELIFTHFGLSGPIILTLSRTVVDELRSGNNVEISIDLKPALDDQKLDARLLRDLNEYGKKQIDNIFKFWLPGKMIAYFLQKTNIDPSKQGHQVSGNERKEIRKLMKNFRLTVTGHRPFREAIITAGGVPTTEINSKTMESKLTRGLYFAGEVLDLDADTGGYNLQIAWSTGWLAGQSSALRE